MHVLLVDDQPDSCDLMALAFRLKGHQVTVAYNGAEAVQVVSTASLDRGAVARSRPVDAIVMDGHMPVMDGLTATRRIRELPHSRDLPIVLLTAFRYTAEEVRAAGINGLLCKPLRPMEVVEHVESLL